MGVTPRGPASWWVGVVLFDNAPDELRRLLASLTLARAAPGAPAVALHLWDNSPTDALRAPVAVLAPEATYTWEGRNLGFGAAHNRLMARAFAAPGPDAYLCVNPDAVLHPACLAALAAEAARAPAAGLVEARAFPDEHPKAYHPRTHRTAWASGCVLLVTRAGHAATGGFDERFFMYCEDVDLSWRVRAAGLDVRVAPGARMHHSTLLRAPSPWRERMVRRSAALLGAKYGDAAYRAQHLDALAALAGPGDAPPPAPPALERPPAALRRVADFRHGLDFARGRW